MLMNAFAPPVSCNARRVWSIELSSRSRSLVEMSIETRVDLSIPWNNHAFKRIQKNVFWINSRICIFKCVDITPKFSSKFYLSSFFANFLILFSGKEFTHWRQKHSIIWKQKWSNSVEMSDYTKQFEHFQLFVEFFGV